MPEIHVTDEFPVRAFTAAVISWGREHPLAYSWREPSVLLWQKLVAEVMLSRTRASQVEPVWLRFCTQFRTAEDLKGLTREQVKELTQGLGLHWRSELLYNLLRQLGSTGGWVPSTYDELKKLPGVGDYCASAMLSLHLGKPAAIIDSNIVRVIARVAGRPFGGETRRKRWLRDLADALTPDNEHTTYNYALLDLAMTVCQPRTPRCQACPLANFCVSSRESSAAQSGNVAVTPLSAGQLEIELSSSLQDAAHSTRHCGPSQ